MQTEKNESKRVFLFSIQYSVQMTIMHIILYTNRMTIFFY